MTDSLPSLSRKTPVVFLDVYGTLFHYERELLLPVFEAVIKSQHLTVETDVLFTRWTTFESAFRRRRVYQMAGEWRQEKPFQSYQEAWTSCFREAFGMMGIRSDPAAAVQLLINDLQRREPYPEVREALEAVHQLGAPMALLSNADASFLFGTLENSRLHFENAVYSEKEEVYKPHPRIFQHGLEKMGVNPDEALYVGDSPFDDIVGAAGAGMATVWVNRSGEAWPLPDLAPDHEVRDLLGLVDIVRERAHIRATD